LAAGPPGRNKGALHDGFCGNREWLAELPPTWLDYWPECLCCGRPASVKDVGYFVSYEDLAA